MRRWSRRASWSAAVSLAIGSTLPGCDSTSPADHEAQFLLRACRWSGNPDGEFFRIVLRDTVEIAAAKRELRERRGRIISGRLGRGDGGFNAPWHWHFRPESTWVVDGSIEICDACPSTVEGWLDGWLEFGIFCPWSAEFVRQEE